MLFILVQAVVGVAAILTLGFIVIFIRYFGSYQKSKHLPPSAVTIERIPPKLQHMALACLGAFLLLVVIVLAVLGEDFLDNLFAAGCVFGACWALIYLADRYGPIKPLSEPAQPVDDVAAQILMDELRKRPEGH